MTRLISCKYCGRIVEEGHRCINKPVYKKKNPKIVKFRNSVLWRHKREEIKERDKYLCRVCLSKKIFNYNYLEVHHIIPISQDYELRLENDNLITLCEMCHEDAERGKISREYLRKCIPPTHEV